MTPVEAAKILGYTPGQVRTLLRQGKIKARKKPQVCRSGYVYDISAEEVERVKSLPTSDRGWPRGKKRK